MQTNATAWLVQQALQRYEADCLAAAARMGSARDLGEVVRGLDVHVSMGMGAVVRSMAGGARARLVVAATTRAQELCEADLACLRDCAAQGDHDGFRARLAAFQREWGVLAGALSAVLVRVEDEAARIALPRAPEAEDSGVRPSRPRP